MYTFFTSTRLAMSILCCLILGAMVGTVVPQRQTLQFYTLEYGENMSRIFQLLHIPDLYGSWWFLFLLGLLCTNLIICSIERFPAVWQQIHRDGSAMPVSRLEGFKNTIQWQEESTLASSKKELTHKLAAAGWKSRRQNHDNGVILFAQKGKYSRLGVFLVHTSILIILTGASIGKIYGFKTHLMLPETEQISTIISQDGTKLYDPGFTVRCDSFVIEWYPSGKIKNYSSRLTILENGEVVISRDVEVNSPLKYKGITFYQSDYEGYNNFIFSITNKETGNKRAIIAPFGKQMQWEKEGVAVGVINAEMNGESVSRMKVWFAHPAGNAIKIWLQDNSSTEIKTENVFYTLHVKQLYATGLQVSKDPGVWVVYVGFGCMIAGLLLAFFMSHRRIWLHIGKNPTGSYMTLSGSCNKHRSAFTKSFNTLAETLQK